MSRKVFISFLGGTNYRYCDYQKDGKSYGNVRFAQEATLNYLDVNSKWAKDDVAMILLTKGAEFSNWVDNGQIDRDTKLPLTDPLTNGTMEGLETRLKQFNIKREPIFNLPDGNDEKEIWEIFNRVFANINNGDYLYFDITHGFRYLPMLVLVLCNYSKFLKKVSVESISYGNYEVARQLGHGLIVDLLPLTHLQDWTFAAGQYLDCGNVKKLVELSKGKYSLFAQNLDKTIADFHTCRGLSLIESTNLKEIKSIMDSMDTSDLPPLKFVFNEIEKDFDKYDDNENVKNGYEAAKWCYKNQLYQQAITILVETVITDVCNYEKIEWKKRSFRDAVSNSLFICSDNKLIENEKGWNIFKREDKEKYQKDYLELKNKEQKTTEEIELMKKFDEEKKYKPKFLRDLLLYRQLIESKRVRDLAELSTLIKDVRDDIDHAGMRDGAKSFAEIETKLNEIFIKLNTIIN